MTNDQIVLLDWVAKIQYPNLKAIYAGTIYLEASAKDSEVRAAVFKMFHQYLPEGFEIKELIRGSIWFVPARENR